MTELPQNVPQKKLLVWETIQEAFVFSWNHRQVLWVWIVIGAILTGLADLVEEFSYGETGRGLTGFPYFAAIVLTPIPGLLVFALLAVYCHRTLLVYQEEENNHKIRFFFTERERKYFVWGIGITLVVLILVVPVTFVGLVIWGQISEMLQGNYWGNTYVEGLFFTLVYLLPIYYFLGRWILVFPAIAIDQEPKLGWSWKQTKDNSWRMFVLVGFLPLTVGNLWYLLSFIGLSELPVFSSFLTSFALFVFTPVEVAVISIAFRELINWTPPPQLPQSTNCEF